MARRKIPFVPQMEAVECGAACLTMALRTFGHHAELSEIREACGVSRDGVSAKQLVRVAREYKLKPRARRVEPSALAEVSGPAVIHWEMNHFVVLQRWTPEEARIVDPAVGPRRIPSEEFDRAFTGICIELTPDEGFVKRARKGHAFQRYVKMLRQARGAIILVAVTSLLLNILGLTLPLTTQLIVDRVLSAGQHTWLTAVGVATLALVLLFYITSRVRMWTVTAVRNQMDRAMSTEVVRHLMSMPVRFFEQRHTGDLVARVEGVRVLREVLAERAVSLLVDGPLLVTYLALLFWYSATLGAIVLGAVLLYGTVYALARPAQLAAFRERLVKDIRAAIQLLQTLRGVVTLKSSGRELSAHEKWLRMFVRALNAATAEARLGIRVDATLLAIRLAAPLAVLAWGGRLVASGTFTVGELLGSTLLAGVVVIPLEGVVQSLLRIQELPLITARMDDVLDTAPEPTGTRACPHLEGHIHLENVTFRYGPTSPPALDGISIDIKSGEKIALVGPSGSGKSTVAKLLLGLVAPESGRVLFDDCDLTDVEVDGVRRQLGAVLQETAMFEGTLRENIALYHPSASLEDVAAAARVAQLHDDIIELPLGYATPISSQSGPLSGGQRQRLALARAVLHRPPILILDEATSALDTLTEAAVDAYLSSRTCTRIVIAHRLSTIRDADRIVVMEQGKIVEEGRHDELLANGGTYALLVAQGESKPTEEKVEVSGTPQITPTTLAAFDVLGALTEADREYLSSVVTRRLIAPEEALMHRGDRSPGLFFVEKGKLDVYLEEPGLGRHKVGQIGAGAVLGEVSVLDGSPVSATLVAAERTSVFHLPLRQIERLRADGDVLAIRLTLVLGRLVAQRLREKTTERANLGEVTKRGGLKHGKKASALVQRDAVAGLRVDQTALGASLTTEELGRIDALGEVRRFSAGEVLFRMGDEADASHLVLAGKIAVTLEDPDNHLTTLKPGELLGEVALFDPGPRSAGCVALEAVTTLAIDHDRLGRLLSAGDTMAAKVLRHMAHSLVRAFRMSDLRLREAIADSSGEAAHARYAREQARVLEAEQDLTATSMDGESRVPVVASDAASSPSACVAALLRWSGRPVPLAAVSEACSEDGSFTPTSLARGARSFGLLLRPLALEPTDLAHLDAPMIIELAAGAHAVAERWSGGRLELASPVDGHTSLSKDELAASFSGNAYEARRDDVGSGSLAQRFRRALADRSSAVWHAVAAALGTQMLALAFPIAVSVIVGRAAPKDDIGLLGFAAAVTGAALHGQGALWAHRSAAAVYLRTKLDAALLDQLLRHVLCLPIDFFERRPTASLLARFEAFRIVRELIGTQGLGAILDLPLLVVSLVALLVLSPSLAGLTLGAMLLVIGTLAVALPRLRRHAGEELEASSAQRGRLIESLAGVATLRVVGARDLGLKRWLPFATRAFSAGNRQERIQGAWFLLADFIRLSTVGMVTWLGARSVLAGEIELGTLMAASTLTGASLLALRDIGSHLVAYARAAHRIALVRETFDEIPEQTGDVRVQPGRLRGRIQLERVSFAYGDGRDVLSDVSISVDPGTKVALVGSSGSGKSTLGKLLLGFYMPRSGRVLFDGRDLATLDLTALRSQLGAVLQDGQLFAGSVRENLALAAPDAPLERITHAAKQADIHDVVVGLPMGYETLLPEGGTSFSGGQRQRLAVARALVHEPPVLLLDEATSALDNISQARIENSLSKLPSTRIVIAHRLSTVIDADQVIVMHQGKVVETGTHAALIQNDGPYARLAKAQLA